MGWYFEILLLLLTTLSLVGGLLYFYLRYTKKKIPEIVDFGASLFPWLLLIFVIRSFIIEPFFIPSQSMYPALTKGDFIVVNKYAYGLHLPITSDIIFDYGEIKRGDVAVFRFPLNPKIYYIKRIIGIPNDVIVIKNNNLYINGKKLYKSYQFDNIEYDNDLGGKVLATYYLNKFNNQEFIIRELDKNKNISFSIVLKKDEYFVMGDNRDRSSDSRMFGPVNKKYIVGKAIYKWMFWESLLSIPSLSRVGSIYKLPSEEDILN